MRVLAVDDLGFRRMQVQLAFCQSGLKFVLDGFCFSLAPAVYQSIIGIPTPGKVGVRPRHPEMKFPPMGPFMTELYPTAVRGTAQGFCYNAGRAIGSFFPVLVGFVSQTLPLGATIALFGAFASGIMVMMLLLLPETRGRSLASLEAAPAE